MKPFERGVSASRMTSIGVGGPIDRLYRPATFGDALKTLDMFRSRGVPVRVIGGGTNIVVDDTGMRTPVIHTGGLRECVALSDGRIRAEAGVPLPRLVARCAAWGLSGLEDVAGIPGSVGGALFMNAGAAGVRISDRLESLEIALPEQGVVRLNRDQINFEYRRSGLSGGLILSARFRLSEDDPDRIRSRIRDRLAARRASQPRGARSAGCFFKNVGGVSAGLLIDRSGCKGMRVGGAMVSAAHANFLINVGGATAADFMELARRVRDDVLARTGCRLSLEVKYWKSSQTRVAVPPREKTVLELVV